MANTNVSGVIFVDTTGQAVAGPIRIKSIKYIGASSGTAVITDGISGSGAPLWKESGTNNLSADEVCIRAQNGIHVAVTNSAQVYIYLE